MSLDQAEIDMIEGEEFQDLDYESDQGDNYDQAASGTKNRGKSENYQDQEDATVGDQKLATGDKKGLRKGKGDDKPVQGPKQSTAGIKIGDKPKPTSR